MRMTSRLTWRKPSPRTRSTTVTNRSNCVTLSARTRTSDSWGWVRSAASSCSSGTALIVHEQFTLRRDGNDERGILPVASRRGFRQIDRNLACGNEGGGGQHDDQEHQHDIDQGDDVDLIQLTIHAGPCIAPGVR